MRFFLRDYIFVRKQIFKFAYKPFATAHRSMRVVFFAVHRHYHRALQPAELVEGKHLHRLAHHGVLYRLAELQQLVVEFFHIKTIYYARCQHTAAAPVCRAAQAMALLGGAKVMQTNGKMAKRRLIFT